MNKYLFVLGFLFLTKSFPQMALDSVKIKFSSDYEMRVLKNLLSEEVVDDVFLDALFAIDSTYTEAKSVTDKGKINNFFASLEKKAVKYNEKKRVKYLFDQTHDYFFKKYELNSYFSDIFKSSTYNCVTGTALYAHLFDHFKIPYQIKETPTHVFLVAYPQTLNIYIETTLPGINGSYAPSEGMVRKAVNELVEMKMITQEQVAKVGHNKAFNDYYYGDENISKQELIGIQYYNKAIVDFNDEKYETAYHNINKSRFFYKNKKTKLFSEMLLTLVVDKIDFKEIDNFKWFLELAEVEDDQGYLKYKLIKILTEDSWADTEFDSIENTLNAEIDDEGLRGELLQELYGIRAERYAQLQQHKKALVYAEKIYELNPNHLTAKNYICRSKIDGLAQKNLTEERLNDLKLLTEKYPFVTDFGIYVRYKIYLYSFLTANNFAKDKSNKGLQYLSVLESLMDAESDGVDFSQEAVGNAYGSVGAFYYRKQQKAKAIEYLERGLSYSPDNENINRKLSLIKNSY